MTVWGPQGSGAGRRKIQLDQRYLIIGAVAAVLVALIVRSHRVSSDQLIYFCVLIPSIILHEISHGAVALAFGDRTAKRAGRLNLNPIRHIDPVGTLLVPAVLSLSGLGAYGWAKPVPGEPGQPAQPAQPHRARVAGRAAHQLRPGRHHGGRASWPSGAGPCSTRASWSVSRA